jgi:malonyl-CoA/methylmalonyl-CoA synthetase
MGAARAPARSQGHGALRRSGVNDNLYERFNALFGDGQRPFIRRPDGAIITYADLHARSGQLANALLDLGVEPGDRVAVQAEKSAEVILLYLACLRVGAVYLPLNTAYTLAELEYFIADAQPRILVCLPVRLPALLPLARQLGVRHVVTLSPDGQGGSLPERANAAASDCVAVPRSSQDLAAILYTSGTTGRSKGAMLTHGNLAANAFCLKACWRYTADDVLLHVLPTFHVHGLFVAVHITLAAGASMILLPAFSPDSLFAQLPAATVFMGVPTYYLRLLQDPRLDRASVAHLRLMVCGSAPLLAATHRSWQQRTGQAILERYGMTETNINTANPYDGERVPGTVGLPLPGVSVRIVDLDTGVAVDTGSVGMIEVRGPNVFPGYWRKPDKTEAEFRADGYFVTGDLGRFDERGYLHIVGRGRDLVITGGYNVYPREIEAQIDALPGVAESAVVGLPHPDFGEGVTALVVARESVPVLSEAEVLAQLRGRLAGYKCPKRVLFVPELPRNSLGKVQKNVLRETYARLYWPAVQALDTGRGEQR